MSITYSGNNQTIQLPNDGGNHERVFVVEVGAGASVALQYKCGAGFVTAKNYTASAVDRNFIKGVQTQLVFTGASTVELGD